MARNTKAQRAPSAALTAQPDSSCNDVMDWVK